MNYYKIDIGGMRGYSFMVYTEEELDENTILDMCLSKGLFEEDIDAEFAEIDDLVSDYDIQFFKKNGCLHNLD